MKYIQPKLHQQSFTCPSCGVLAKQEWSIRTMKFENYVVDLKKSLGSATCQHCTETSIWIKDKMYYPENGNSPFPNAEMPENVKNLYLEAASISNKSPRGSAALLRLAIQVLCKELGEPGENINTDIKSLVKKGLPEIVQQSLDVVRVTGNDAVHPGQIDTDNQETVGQLFDLTNVIIEYMIALPKKVSGIYLSLPSSKLDGINKRDGK
ncbi:protein of unknown function [Chishuiella changwenlii]|uniref:DUF4145 domain-containing protein n=1 Tax=Chishuiella changwenlii TaxID=1434701 RepID=A0A1M6STY5_9FLAO|nr:DUF4145 domain-containing protein [Chishuiella changwenlii]GGF07210.1 hypothetical protein GCM10010984_25580 [Chishuiella changwenlii]SHK48090.1 protein of unknown function [Chishuiella changwenlii]